MTPKVSSVRVRVFGGALAAALLQACASTAPAPVATPAARPAPSTPAPPAPAAPQFVATPGLSPRERTQRIEALLNDGRRDQARAEVAQLLQDAPGDRVAQSLSDQIDKDPKLLLGEKNFPYKLQPGDTFADLAQRFLGDRGLFYALARYNGVDRPAAAEAGQTVLIPGVPGKVAPRSSRTRQEGEEGEARTRKPAPVPAAPSQPARDPARAGVLRGQGLSALNGGAVDRAVALLKQAAALDPDNAAIKRDLARAQRIQATLHK